MIKTALRKMLSNKWLYLCLLIGLILVVSFISCIPMYTNGVLQRVLTKDLEKIQTTQSVYPGKYWATVNISKGNDANNFSTQFYKYEGKLAKELYSAFDFDTVDSTTIVSCANIYFSSPTLADSSVILTLRGMSGIEEHVNVLYGEMMTESSSADYDFEAMVNQYTYSSKGFKIGEIYTIKSNSTLSREYRVKIVGVFSVPNTADPYWPETSTHTMNDCVYINYDKYTSTLIGNNSNNAVTSVTFYNAIDYSKITLDDVEPIISAYESLEEYVKANSSRVTLRFPLIETVRQYSGKITTLNVLFLLLQIPVFLMLAFYIYMVAGLISNMDRDEIAVLKSRGATNLQIFRKYTVEMGLLCLIAALVGPFLGLFLGSFLGSSNGFLEFVNRSALKISLDSTTYLYVLCAVIVCLIATLIPVFSAARYNIVHMKRNKGAATKMPLWQKMGVDVILLGVSLYGYISRRAVTDIASTQMWSDPIIFILSATFILGAGLLFIRIYPLILRLIFRVTRSFLPATLYVSFNHVARGSGKNTFLMLFLVMTLTVGLFSANSARSINTRQERAIEHLNGADVVVSEIWRQKETAVGTVYEEPALNRFSSVNGLSDPTRVVMNTKFKANISHEIRDAFITIMAIEPYGFSKVVNTYPSQYKNGINTHIASLYKARNAAIISSAFARDAGLSIGDSITYTITSNATEFYVADIVESWPGIDTNNSEYFIITNYDHYKATNPINSYYVWLNRDDNVPTSDIYTAFAEGDFTLNSISVTSQLIADAKNDPSIQGTNGVLTLGFLISVCISVAGFLIFWILSVRERVLQFGLLGAMGLPMRSLISILAIEQLLISLVSVLAGVVIGYFTSVMYIPFIGAVYMSEGAGALFTLVRSGADYTKIYAIVIFMLLLACVALGITVRRINLTQALKLGED